ncbi:hypothetical protein [Nonomuraea ceibae]|uniref:hypothetical protein n=1 Tax=Nonomuraea ceibae TaxID=1935170 RepID=UPI001C5FF2B0|nr:hypothetical protein [Nonomuraea ceibae]
MNNPRQQPEVLTAALTNVRAIAPDSEEAEYLPLEILFDQNDGKHTVQFPRGLRRQFLTSEQMLQAAAQLIVAVERADQQNDSQ